MVEWRFDPKLSVRKKRLLLILGIAAVIPMIFWYVGALGDNFRVVTGGKFYRSGQMDAEDLRRTIITYGIQTVVNLKGASKKDWYLGEKKAVEDCHAQYVIIDLNPWKLPAPQELAKLVWALQNGPYPMLVHCQAGSDRAGLASVLYRMIVEHAPLEVAWNEQLTWRYGHFSFGKSRAMDDFFELFRQTGKGKSLEKWIAEDYTSLYSTRKRAKTIASYWSREPDIEYDGYHKDRHDTDMAAAIVCAADIRMYVFREIMPVQSPYADCD